MVKLTELHTLKFLNPQSTSPLAQYTYISNPTGSYNVTDPPPSRRWSLCSFSMKLGFDLLGLLVTKSIVEVMLGLPRLIPIKDPASAWLHFRAWNKSSCPKATMLWILRKAWATNREMLKQSPSNRMWKSLWRWPKSYHLIVTSWDTEAEEPNKCSLISDPQKAWDRIVSCHYISDDSLHSSN